MSYSSFEEVQEKYPIGCSYYIETHTYRGSFYNSRDLEYYYQKYGPRNVTIIDDYTVEYKVQIYGNVDGYVFDGEYWHPAHQMNPDHWQTI